MLYETFPGQNYIFFHSYTANSRVYRYPMLCNILLWTSDAQPHEMQKSIKCKCVMNICIFLASITVLFPGFFPTLNTCQDLKNFYLKLQYFPDFFRIYMNPVQHYQSASDSHVTMMKKIPRRPRSVARQLIPCRPFSRRGWNPNKLAYKLAGWPAQLAASAFRQPCQYANSPGHRA